MLHKVARDDEVSFRNNKAWLYRHPAKAPIFADRERIWREVRQAYAGSFKKLVYGETPSQELILNSLSRIAERLEKVVWIM